MKEKACCSVIKIIVLYIVKSFFVDQAGIWRTSFRKQNWFKDKLWPRVRKSLRSVRQTVCDNVVQYLKVRLWYQ